MDARQSKLEWARIGQFWRPAAVAVQWETSERSPDYCADRRLQFTYRFFCSNSHRDWVFVVVKKEERKKDGSYLKSCCV
ncbi:hypothetical protein GWI33_001073 [Rhynchophorus ferrugineus]|uniref:Uncharacterized protein n=1 Tax=Rhynchophorus ferrugineus TaxID=354439 RepID=A0A834ILM5_RHYFE|nr:hypothetical protein GWI33_001073 [Rhynchophorus ferrugineus]